MSRRQGMLTCSVLLAGLLLSGCSGAVPSDHGARGSASSGSPTPATTATTATMGATGVARTTGASTATGASTDPVAAFASAKAAFSAARTARYVVKTTYAYAEGESLTMERTFTIDRPHGLLALDAAFQQDSKKGRQRIEVSFVQAGGRSYIRKPGSSTWSRASADDLAAFGVAPPRKPLSTMPAALESFVATTDIGKGELSGEADARDYFETSGLSAIMESSKVLPDLRGRVDAHVQLQDGAVKSMRFLGRDHSFYLDGEGDVPDELESLVLYAEVEVRVTAIDHAVRIEDPRRPSSGTA